MEFRFGPEEEVFRQEVRQFLAQELPPDWQGRNDREHVTDEEWELNRAFTKKLAQKGWLTLAWPQEYGGMGASPMMQVVFNEEMAYQRAPVAMGQGISIAGPTIIVYGSDEQKGRHLPPIVRGETVWCQGFSEPGAGSDLASLQTRAVEDGDDFVVTGQKIWTSHAHRADWCILLARTDPDAPKHRGISYFLMDMRSPGVTVQPLVNMLNSHAFNQVFLDNVRIPRENLLGEKNRGWYVATTTLDIERSGINRVVAGLRLLEELVGYTRETKVGGQPLFERAAVRHKLAELAVEFQVGRLLSYRVASMQSRGEIPNAEASVAKLYGSELQQRLAEAGVNLLGLGGQLAPGSPWAPLAGKVESYYLAAVSYTIGAGTSEIQRNIIASRGLGLPRS
ncbi:MAG: acyl-CoA dehydrogenase [Dehalococcoidia bacterium]